MNTITCKELKLVDQPVRDRARATLLAAESSQPLDSTRLSHQATDDQESSICTTRAGGPASVGLRLFRKGGSCRGGSAPYSAVIEVSSD